MTKIIIDKQIVEDNWQILRLAEGEQIESVPIPSGSVLVPLKVWQARAAELATRSDVGIWFASDEQARDLQEDPNRFPVIAIDFPKFADGRGYSIAFNLRTRRGFSGQLRAVGDVLRDQLFYMQRVGFNAFAVRADKDIDNALKGLTDFSISYQTSWDQKNPLFRRVDRQGAST